MTMVGADVAQLRELATEMRTAASRLSQTRKSIEGLIRRTTWSGTDRIEFTVRWTRDLGPSLQSASDRLDEAGRSLYSNAAEQEQASQSNGEVVAAAFAMGTSMMAAIAATGPVALPGDAGGTFEWEERGSWAAASGSPQQAGANVLSRALDDTADQSKIAPDEFEIIKLDNGKYLVIMPGVTDLSKTGDWAVESGKRLLRGDLPERPPLGLDPFHRSARDLDQGAVQSATSSAVDDNLYAQYVIEAMKEYNIPPGSDVALIGHSYGADTAIDLAADPSFNGGPDGYSVSHVMAAGYYVEPTLDNVPSGTNVLAIENGNDFVVQMERAGEGPVRTVDGAVDLVGGAASWDGDRVLAGAGSLFGGAHETITDTQNTVVNFGKDAISGAKWSNPFAGFDDAAANVVTTEPSTHVTENGHVKIVFDGAGKGAGHHPDNYSEYITSTDAPEVAAFNVSLAEAGYADSGAATAHDVSVPE